MVGLCLQMASAFPRPCLPATFCFLQELEKLINEAIHIQIECLKELLQYEIQITFDILDLKLQKKTLNLNAPIPPLVPIAGQSGQDEALKLSKTNKGKKAKAKK